MARFNDAKGRQWTLVVTVGSIKRVRETCGIDLADVETAATRLTGLSNAYSRLRDEQDRTAKSYRKMQDLEDLYRETTKAPGSKAAEKEATAKAQKAAPWLPPGWVDARQVKEAELGASERVYDDAIKKIEEVEALHRQFIERAKAGRPSSKSDNEQLQSLREQFGLRTWGFRKQPAFGGMQDVLDAAKGQAKDAEANVAAVKEHLRRADELAERLKTAFEKRAKARQAAADAGKAVGDAFFGAMSKAVGAADALLKPVIHALKNRELSNELARLKAESIADPRQREEALTNADFERRKQEMQLAGADPSTIAALEENRQQAIANIRQKYARDEAERARTRAETAKQFDQRTIDETERLRIEATMRGRDKQLALLKLRQQQEMREAETAGGNLDLLRRKHALEQRMLGIGESMSRVAGTFSGSAVAGLGAGNVQERIARAIERQAPKQQDMVDWLVKMFSELKRITLEAAT